MTHDDIVEMTAPFEGFVGRKCQHVATKGFYVITGVFVLESTLQVHFTYQTLHREPLKWARPVSEFLDGRFRIGDQ